jgi:hypothetical protein
MTQSESGTRDRCYPVSAAHSAGRGRSSDRGASWVIREVIPPHHNVDLVTKEESDVTEIDAAKQLPEFCAACRGARRPYERFLFDRGTSGAHVVWECDHCGDSGTRMVGPDFLFARTDLHSFNIS